MDRSTALLAVLAALLAACGDDGAAPPTAGRTAPVVDAPDTPLPEPHPIEFVEGLAAAREAAESDDTLFFVYLGRHNPT